jgi:hypothetical protein
MNEENEITTLSFTYRSIRKMNIKQTVLGIVSRLMRFDRKEG